MLILLAAVQDIALGTCLSKLGLKGVGCVVGLIDWNPSLICMYAGTRLKFTEFKSYSLLWGFLKLFGGSVDRILQYSTVPNVLFPAVVGGLHVGKPKISSGGSDWHDPAPNII